MRHSAPRLRICFVMLQELGHVTTTINLKGAVARLEGVDACWVEVPPFRNAPGAGAWPPLPEFVRAGAQIANLVGRALHGRTVDALFFNPQNLATMCQWHMLRVPTVLMVDATPLQFDAAGHWYGHPADRNPALRRVKRLGNVVNFRLAAAVIAYSRWAGDSVVRDYATPAQRVHVIHPGVDTERWRPEEAGPAESRVQLLFVGGQFERKGGALLLEVFRQLGLARHADLHLVTQAELAPMPGVFVHRDLQSNSPELVRLFRQADVFVLPTLADFSPQAAVEATAVGLPIVATAMAGLPDIVCDRSTGYLVPPGDGHALGCALVRLIDEPELRRRFGAAARAHALANFDAYTNGRRIVELIRGVASSVRQQ
ncbi:MAG TPA: glycosyltransferase family 4 protein [Chloroflexota bacterium]|jgi:hypothetical protein